MKNNTGIFAIDMDKLSNEAKSELKEFVRNKKGRFAIEDLPDHLRTQLLEAKSEKRPEEFFSTLKEMFNEKMPEMVEGCHLMTQAIQHLPDLVGKETSKKHLDQFYSAASEFCREYNKSLLDD